MKIKSSFFNYLLFFNILILTANSLSLKSTIHPNVGEIFNEYHKLVKPFYQKEFFPQEVSSIKEPIKPVFDFTSAEIVGPLESKGGIDQVNILKLSFRNQLFMKRLSQEEELQ